MTEPPQITIRKSRTVAPIPKIFSFTSEMVRMTKSEYLQNYRKNAWQAFETLPIPTPQEEAWRRTDLHALQASSFKLADSHSHQNLPIPPEELLQPMTTDICSGQVILLPDQIQSHLDPEVSNQGVIFTDLQTAEKEHPQMVEKILGKVVHPEEGKFAALAGALAQSGVFLYVPKNVQIDQPFQSLLWGPGANFAYISHILIYLEEGAEVTYMHESASPTEPTGQTMHAGIVEIYVGTGARLRFVELQSWGEHVWNFSHERARVDAGGNLEWVFGAIGSRLTKNFSELDLVGQGSNGRMSGFYFADHDQHLDHDTQQNHRAAHTTSDLLFKGALLGNSHSVWQGMIYVAPGAAKADGYQANRNLMLSPNAHADSIPGLEILADDVRCTHGATVGKIDQEQVFYLLSRGIPQREAERLIVEGFFEPIMQRIPFEGVRQRFQKAIHQKMASYST